MGERWQSYDCPISGIDFDIDEPVKLGETFYCSGCGGRHVATAELVTEYEMRDGEPRVVELQP